MCEAYAKGLQVTLWASCNREAGNRGGEIRERYVVGVGLLQPGCTPVFAAAKVRLHVHTFCTTETASCGKNGGNSTIPWAMRWYLYRYTARVRYERLKERHYSTRIDAGDCLVRLAGSERAGERAGAVGVWGRRGGEG